MLGRDEDAMHSSLHAMSILVESAPARRLLLSGGLIPLMHDICVIRAYCLSMRVMMGIVTLCHHLIAISAQVSPREYRDTVATLTREGIIATVGAACGRFVDTDMIVSYAGGILFGVTDLAMPPEARAAFLSTCDYGTLTRVLSAQVDVQHSMGLLGMLTGLDRLCITDAHALPGLQAAGCAAALHRVAAIHNAAPATASPMAMQVKSGLSQLAHRLKVTLPVSARR